MRFINRAVSLIGGDTVCAFECDESLSLRSALNNINLLLADLAEGTKIENLNDEIQSDATVTGRIALRRGNAYVHSERILRKTGIFC